MVEQGGFIQELAATCVVVVPTTVKDDEPKAWKVFSGLQLACSRD
jgi:hypothetical protein